LLVLDVSNDTPSSSRLELTTNEIFQMDHLLFHRALLEIGSSIFYNGT